MNRYVITKAQLRGQEYLISALYDENRKMVEVLPERADKESLFGSIYIARVQNVVKNLNAAFVQIQPGRNCYLPLEDCEHPFFTKKLSAKKELVQGDELLVQVSKEALKTKDPSVTTNLNFTGRYAVLTTGNRKLGISSKLLPKDRERFLKLLQRETENKEDGVMTKTGNFKVPHLLDYGLIIRTNAKDASDEQVLAEVRALKERWFGLAETALHKTCYSCLYREPASYLKNLADIRQDTLEEIVTDDRCIFEEICVAYDISPKYLMTSGSVSVPVNEIETADPIRIRYYTDKMISLSALYGVTSALEDLLKEKIWMKSGAYLMIEHTEALTVIDINTGKNIAKKNMQENFLKVNMEAAAEIARQIRLRNISGMILVDFINLASKEAESELISFFRGELKKDPVPAQLVDMTKLGLVEVTRKKVKKSLRELMK